MNLTDRLIKATGAMLFGGAALVAAPVLPTATVANAAPDEPISCDEWMIDDEGNYVCGPAEDECPPFVAVCNEITNPGPNPDPGPDPDPDPGPGRGHGSGPARPVVTQPSFTG